MSIYGQSPLHDGCVQYSPKCVCSVMCITKLFTEPIGQPFPASAIDFRFVSTSLEMIFCESAIYNRIVESHYIFLSQDNGMNTSKVSLMQILHNRY